MENFWFAQPIDNELSKHLQEETKLPQAIINLLLSIGVKTSDEVLKFLKPTLKQIHNPLLISDMTKAVLRINEAIDKGEKIIFHGDYDCDGVTTTAVAVKAFKLLGVDIDFYVPNRFTDGYGLHPRNMERFAHEYDLIISGDTGIRAFEGAKIVKDIGKADLIITDHHEPFVRPMDKLEEADKNSVITEFGDKYIALPDAYAVIDPHRLGDEHPCKTHAGVGVIFKTMLAVFRHRKEPVQPLLEMMDLVATGTIVDLAHQVGKAGEQLDFEVRVMCTAGLKILNDNPPIWMKALCKAMNIDGEITDETLGFTIGPILNAVGRLDDPTPAADILLEEDYESALEQAEYLVEVNNERKRQTEVAFKIIDELKEDGDESRYDYGIVVHSDLYEQGIAGLVAGKFQEAFYRPAIALTSAEVDGKLVYKGSARSIPGINMLDMLYKMREDIGDFIFGGHAPAAGLTISPEQYEPAIESFRNACSNHDVETFIRRFYYQSEISLDQIDDRLMSYIKQMRPFGFGNPKPIFKLSNATVTLMKPHSNNKGFNLTLQQGRHTIKGLSFNLLELFKPLYDTELSANKEVSVDLLFHPTYNEWRGETKIQLNIEDIKISKK